ncbi:ATP-binding protein [Burkholderia ubonensis]|uniref:ATP-binding protein n=1 Tax=Burkholderia ubonensis TaxID=101571 RepID=UPI00076DBE21|nr:helicase HerA-like domain-containing protein [Burkholderia ubonensis]KVP70521.1 hypothetical protein WJ93_14845 [Burkholderia ubonensis]
MNQINPLMSEPSLTEEVAVNAIRDFFRGKPFLFFGTGMSCALDSGFGMPALRDALVDAMTRRTLTDVQRDEWSNVTEALQLGKDLESALNFVNDQDLLKIVAELTGEFVADLDKRFAYAIAQGAVEWPASSDEDLRKARVGQLVALSLPGAIEEWLIGIIEKVVKTPVLEDLPAQEESDSDEVRGLDLPREAMFIDRSEFSAHNQVMAFQDPVEQRAIENFEKIAKEGRKYGVALFVISQRPADVSTTILSQCNNVIALRLTNGDDQNTVKRLMPESLEGLMDTLPILDIGEALVVGDAVLLPSRIRIHAPKENPLSATIDFWDEWSKAPDAPDFAKAVENMRRQNRA